jgi:hypothetical protein
MNSRLGCFSSPKREEELREKLDPLSLEPTKIPAVPAKDPARNFRLLYFFMKDSFTKSVLSKATNLKRQNQSFLLSIQHSAKPKNSHDPY